jgi:hypothetical protein
MSSWNHLNAAHELIEPTSSITCNVFNVQCSAHRLSLVLHSSILPKYPVKALVPQGTLQGLQMGANALKLLNMPGFFSAIVRAPCPPMLCPVMLALLVSS